MTLNSDRNGEGPRWRFIRPLNVNIFACTIVELDVRVLLYRKKFKNVIQHPSREGYQPLLYRNMARCAQSRFAAEEKNTLSLTTRSGTFISVS